MTKRNPNITKERILQAGITEFGSQGFGGARTEAIAERAGCNIRMLYHYFGGKQALYVASLDRVYSAMREKTKTLNLLDIDPVAAMNSLVEFTFDHITENPDFVRLSGVENTQGGKYLQSLPHLSTSAAELISTIDKIVEAGQSGKVFKSEIDSLQLYVSIMALSCLHISHKHTLGVSFGPSIEEASWIAERRNHVAEIILSYVTERK